MDCSTVSTTRFNPAQSKHIPYAQKAKTEELSRQWTDLGGTWHSPLLVSLTT